eukprot:5103068-Prymnesium_polylepis.1
MNRRARGRLIRRPRRSIRRPRRAMRALICLACCRQAYTASGEIITFPGGKRRVCAGYGVADG